jgi:hypothetical protein
MNIDERAKALIWYPETLPDSELYVRSGKIKVSRW